MLPADIDGTTEEGTPFISAHGQPSTRFQCPDLPGLRFYHTMVSPAPISAPASMAAKVGLVYIEPKGNPGAYDQEVFFGPEKNSVRP